jgi:ribosomal protein S18 acetylase RimI-like enzyme
MTSNRSFIRLSASHIIKPFDYEEEDVDLKEFLFDDAKNYLRQLLSVTYIIEDNTTTIAYLSVSNDKVSLTEVASKSFWKKQVSKSLHFEKRGLSSFPAVKIGRLAVSKNYQRQGIGKMIIDWVKESFTNQNKTGCLFIIVDAINRKPTIDFYKACGFDFLNPKDITDKTRLMYYCLLEKVEEDIPA